MCKHILTFVGVWSLVNCYSVTSHVGQDWREYRMQPRQVGAGGLQARLASAVASRDQRRPEGWCYCDERQDLGVRTAAACNRTPSDRGPDTGQTQTVDRDSATSGGRWRQVQPHITAARPAQSPPPHPPETWAGPEILYIHNITIATHSAI